MMKLTLYLSKNFTEMSDYDIWIRGFVLGFPFWVICRDQSTHISSPSPMGIDCVHMVCDTSNRVGIYNPSYYIQVQK